MKKLAQILVVLAAVTAFSSQGEPASTNADPKVILQDLQHKMASVKSVYLEFTQERQFEIIFRTH